MVTLIFEFSDSTESLLGTVGGVTGDPYYRSMTEIKVTLKKTEYLGHHRLDKIIFSLHCYVYYNFVWFTGYEEITPIGVFSLQFHKCAL